MSNSDLWTSEPPKEQGFYFWRIDSDDWEPEPVSVFYGNEIGNMYCSRLGEPYNASAESIGGQWWPIKIEVPE